VSRSVFVGVVFMVACADAAAAQSGEPDLAAIARQAEAAKASAPKAKKSYTNADLGAGGVPPAPVELGEGFMSSSLDKPISAEEMLLRSEAKAEAELKDKAPDEVFIKQAAAIRRQVEKLAPSLSELKSRPKSPDAERQKRVDQQIADIERQMEGFRKRWAGLEAEARTTKVSLAVLMPAPAFPK